MDISKNDIVGQLVAADYRTASVFKAHKIDFCCNGGITVAEVCKGRDVDADALVGELMAATANSEEGGIDFQSWDMDLLADYIEKKHHRYVEGKIPELAAYLNKIARVHGGRHPELLEIETLFSESARGLLSHMKKEETILFPFIRKMSQAKGRVQPPFGTVRNPINMMMHEHDTEGERFRKIAELSGNYSPPQDACNTYRVAFALLKEFEEDLHMHIHLENNILFPKAVEAEKTYANA